MNDDESKGSTTRRPSARAILGLLPVLLAATGGMILMEPPSARLDPEPGPFLGGRKPRHGFEAHEPPPVERALVTASATGTRSKAERKARRRARRMRAKGGR